MLLLVKLRLMVPRHMLERRDKDKRFRKRLEKANIADSLPPSVTLFDDLAKFLNETKASTGKRIVQILEQMLELEAMTRPIDGVVWADLSLKKSDPKKFKLLWDIAKKTAFLERELKKYSFIPRAEVVVGGSGSSSEWAAWWRWSNKKQERHLRMDPGEALQMVLKLTQIGYLSRLRHCTRCTKWLYARFRHQVFCSVKCQQKNYTESEVFKVHRRLYMRRRYQELMKSPFPRRRPR
jgi:hypothetical protein